MTEQKLEKFTERARRVLRLAQNEALALGHKYVDTGHILLALTDVGDGGGVQLLRRHGAELFAVRDKTVRMMREHPSETAETGLTHRANRAMELAADEARRLGDDQVGTEHLVLGLLAETDGVADEVLHSLGVTLAVVRSDLQQMSRPSQATREPAQIIDGKAVADAVRHEVADRTRRLKAKRGITPGLALVLVGDNPSSLSYIRSKGDTAEQAGLYSDVFHFSEATEMERVISHVQDLNSDARFHGILVQLPLPKHMHEDTLIGAMEPAKDADGVTATNLGRILRGEPAPWPATPNGIVELLHRTGHPPSGKHVVVCGRSNIVGKPIAAILMQKNEKANATVTICHTGTPDIARYTRQADILIAAMGVPRAITADMVKPGVVVIDVGNNWIEDATRKSGRRLVGDVDYEGVREVASAITPVPGGVGPMTIAMLLMNTVWLAERYGQPG